MRLWGLAAHTPVNDGEGREGGGTGEDIIVRRTGSKGAREQEGEGGEAYEGDSHTTDVRSLV